VEAAKAQCCRIPDYLSPTSLGSYKKDAKEFFLRYLATTRSPRLPQTQAMSVGSAFDAIVKAYLHNVIFGPDAGWSESGLFEAQVEAHNRDFAVVAGRVVWNLYKGCGALQELVLSLTRSVSAPVFETTMTKLITLNLDSGFHGSVPLRGVPDLLFSTGDCQVILDWKVNGYLSKASPKRGYVMCYPTMTSHRDVFVTTHYGLPCVSGAFEELYSDWAAQVTTYSWLLGSPCVNRTLNQIHQIAWNSEHVTKSRVAVHSGLCSPDYQRKLFGEYVDLWEKIQECSRTGVFNDAQGAPLDVDNLNQVANTMIGDSLEQRTFRELTRSI
jgi:hypothetical protein